MVSGEGSRVALGLDIGGTKANALSNVDGAIYRYDTLRFQNPYEVIDAHLLNSGIKPEVICLGMAAVRNHDGSMRLVKRGWPRFDPNEAETKYEGIKFVTANDLIATAVGVIEGNALTQPIKKGIKHDDDASLVYTWSTGIGAAIVIPTDHDYVYLPTANGHAGLAPQQEDEIEYLKFVSRHHKGKISTEFALGGEDGMRNLLNFYYAKNPDELKPFYNYVSSRSTEGTPIGSTLLETAENGEGIPQSMARTALNLVGGLLGYALRNQVLSADVREIKMTGSLSLGLLSYIANRTTFLDRFVDKSARCAYIPEDTAIDLVLDPQVAVKGSLMIAEKELQ